MKDGRTVQVKKYDEILVPGSDFIQLVGAQNAALSSTLESNRAVSNSADNAKSIIGKENMNENIDDERGAVGLAPAAQIIKEEEREIGRVRFPVYWKYITTAYGGALVILASIILQFLRVGSNYWLAWETPSSRDVKPVVSGFTLVTVYASLALGICFCTLVVDSLVTATGYKTATILFKNMLESIFCAPMSFFNATPAGRILNRVSAECYLCIPLLFLLFTNYML